MGDTEISWTHRPGTRGRTWNPTQGCSILSEGCRNCYAMRLANRFSEDGWSKGLINPRNGKWNGVVRLASHKLADPLKWRQPSTVFVNSMSDLFHEELSNEEIAAVFGVMAAAPQHTFQVLTKRARRMREWFEWASTLTPTISGAMREAARSLLGSNYVKVPKHVPKSEWCLPNVWVGVSVEDQAAAYGRIPDLLRTPAAVRFLSCEPLIGPVRLHEWLLREHGLKQIGAPPGIRWVIGGCESGPGARVCSVEWLRSLRDQCAGAGVPFFLKQAAAVDGQYTITDERPVPAVLGRVGELIPIIGVGSGSKEKARGVIELPYLDGAQHAAFPEVP